MERLKSLLDARLRTAATFGCVGLLGAGCGSSAQRAAAVAAERNPGSLDVVATCPANTQIAFGELESDDAPGYPGFEIVTLPISCVDVQGELHWPTNIRRGDHVRRAGDYVLRLSFTTAGEVVDFQKYTQPDTAANPVRCGTITLFALAADTPVEVTVMAPADAASNTPRVDC